MALSATRGEMCKIDCRDALASYQTSKKAMRACSCSPPLRSPGPAGRRCKEKRVLLNFARPTMPIRSPLPAAIAALLCISLPAGGQDHTPDRARKTGTVAPTSVGVSFKEWTVPTPRSFPHDPLAAADGAIWYTGQMASTLGPRIRRRVLSKNIGRRRPLGSSWTGCR